MVEHQNMSITNLYDTLSSYKLLGKNQNEMMQEMMEFNELNSTTETVTKYSSLLVDLLEKIEKSRISKNIKALLQTIITSFISLSSSNECKNIIIQDQNNLIINQTSIIEQVKSEYQKERDEHNLIRKKYQENPKEENISFTPNVDLSITLNNKGKILTNQDCVKLAKKAYETNLSTEKFKRISINDDENIKNKVSRVYAKENKGKTSNIIQKNK